MSKKRRKAKLQPMKRSLLRLKLQYPEEYRVLQAFIRGLKNAYEQNPIFGKCPEDVLERKIKKALKSGLLKLVCKVNMKRQPEGCRIYIWGGNSYWEPSAEERWPAVFTLILKTKTGSMILT